jgi:cysteine desulfurase / selenocysteine lyase
LDTVRDRSAAQCGIVTFTANGCVPAAIQAGLAAQHINVTYSPVTSTLLDMRARGLESVVRASVHYFNTEEELERFCTALRAVI